MPEYKIVMGERTCRIYDENGNVVPYEEAFHITEYLQLFYGSNPYIYLLHDAKSDLYKIGFSKQPIKKRIAQIALKEKIRPRLIHRFFCPCLGDARLVEEFLHYNYRNYRVWGEWFQLPAEAVEEIKSYKLASDFWKPKNSQAPST